MAIHSPSIVQVLSGKKRLFWRDSYIDIGASSLLLVDNSLTVSFENMPSENYFSSRFFSFNYQPPDSIVELGIKKQQKTENPVIRMTPSLNSILNALFHLDTKAIDKQSQRYFLLGLYQQLAEYGVLPLLFKGEDFKFNHRVKRYLSTSPGINHTIESVSERFFISRATLIRRLKIEGYQFKEILREVRLNHALHLMQNGLNDILILSEKCGYLSDVRFSQRFQQRFGLTPKDYLSTLGKK
ncbi:AraC family transcriptional regulator [Vibrio nitrifigilis]|uniref:AraC family transcriptional regulator n=1 Tax=Vibrio nitrifigilis TaxID=2789781 RepID=UPI002E37B3C0|nr:AraC family transcriptional regulator [Vibrio nitrifigilis]